MNNLEYRKVSCMLEDILPQQVYVNSNLFRATDKGHLRRNYMRIREMLVVRFWLYLDFNPNLQKALHWIEIYSQLDIQVCEQTFESVYEFVRRENLLTCRISRFKAAFKESRPSVTFLLGPLWSLVEDLLLQDPGAVTEDFYISVLQKVVQWTRVSSKLKLEMPTLEEEAYERFEANELRLREVWSKSDETRDRYLSEMRDILSSWIDMANFEPGPGRHGSGAVAENVGRHSWLKHPLMGERDQKSIFFDAKFHFDFFLTDSGSCSLTPMAMPQESRPSTVPKNVKKVRMISMQPVGKMYRQEAVLQGYYAQWHKPVIRSHFPIFDRCVNQALALTASRCGKMATLDLSNASDSVSVQLIKHCTKGKLRYALLLNRVKSIGRIALLCTYATMGDASVFPTETLIIGAAVQLAINLARLVDPYVPNRFVVFGDDIICPNNYFVLKYIHDIFARIGFVINDDKSFTHGPYRESCGVEAYLGHEIQPWYFRTEPVGLTRLQSLIGAANECYSRGYRYTRRYFINEYKRMCGCSIELLPFTEDPLDSSRFHTETLCRGRFRCAKTPSGEIAYGQLERQELTLKTRKFDVPPEYRDLEEVYRLQLWLYQHDKLGEKQLDLLPQALKSEDIPSKPGPQTYMKVRKWVSVCDLTR